MSRRVWAYRLRNPWGPVGEAVTTCGLLAPRRDLATARFADTSSVGRSTLARANSRHIRGDLLPYQLGRAGVIGGAALAATQPLTQLDHLAVKSWVPP